jgi:hypothetical protein
MSNGGIIGPVNDPTPDTLTAGNKTSTDVLTLLKSLKTNGVASGVWNMNDVYNNVKNSTWVNLLANAIAQAGGTETINSLSMGSYDYTYYNNSQTVSSFTNSDWFTTTADSRSALIYINGSLTIDSGQTFTPSNRKLFTAIFIAGDLIVNGTLTMNSRGANHSSGGSNISSNNIKIATGTFGAVTDPQVPSSGGSGGSGSTGGAGNAGSAGTSGGTGGGGAGSINNGASSSGNGAAGSSFSGGPGGGEGNGPGGTVTNGTPNGGVGGNGAGNAAHSAGTGNPGGSDGGGGGTFHPGGEGTGGVLFIFVRGNLSGSGTISGNGLQNTGGPGSAYGGSSGGGSVTILYNGTDTSSYTLQANGGTRGGYGDGGAGTARKLSGSGI